MHWQDEYLRMVSAAQRCSYELTEWEQDFLVSVKNQILEGRLLSRSQIEKLDQIYEKAMS